MKPYKPPPFSRERRSLVALLRARVPRAVADKIIAVQIEHRGTSSSIGGEEVIYRVVFTGGHHVSIPSQLWASEAGTTLVVAACP